MNPASVLLLSQLGYKCRGIDPDARDHHLYAQDGTPQFISVPAAGCSAHDLARIIYHAVAAAARKEIRDIHNAFLSALKF